MENIIRFVMLAQSDRYTLTELCEQFGISRKTGNKHLARYRFIPRTLGTLRRFTQRVNFTKFLP